MAAKTAKQRESMTNVIIASNVERLTIKATIVPKRIRISQTRIDPHRGRSW